MPLSLSKIKTFRTKIAGLYTTEAKLKELAKNEAKTILPVVTQVLTEIQEKLTAITQKTEGVANTQEFVGYALKILKETDERQQITLANLWNLRSIFADITKERIEDELGKMVRFANSIEVTADTISLWEEVGLGLEGLYKRIYDKVPKEKNGELKRNKQGLVDPVDREDKLFHGLFQLTKFSIVSYYHQVYVAIYEKINEFNKQRVAPHVTLQMQHVGAEPEVIPEAQTEDDASLEVSSPPNPMPLHVYSRTRLGHRYILFDFPDGEEEKIPVLLEEYKKIMHINQDLVIEPEDDAASLSRVKAEGQGKSMELEELPYEFLEKYNEDVDDIKLSVFICGLDLYKLNARQSYFLKNFKPNIVASLDAYVNSKFTTWGLPTIIWSPAHIKIVEEKRDKIISSEDLAENLKDLYDLLIEVRGDNSVKVRNRVTKLLHNAYTITFRNAGHLPQQEHGLTPST